MIEMQTLVTWREEIETELTAAQQQLADAIDAQRAAQTARDACAAEQQATQAALAALQTPLAPFIAVRVRAVDDDLQKAAGAVAQAREQISLLRERIANLELAEMQTERLLVALTPSTKGEEEHADAV